MAKLPSYRDLGGLPSGRSGRTIASWDTSAVGRGMARAGQTQAAAARNIGQGIRSLGAGLNSISAGQEVRDKKVQAEASRVEKFETQRRFMEFKAQNEELYTTSLESASPGAVGWQEQTVKAYQDRAREFFDTVPDSLKSQYDNKLFAEEDRLSGKARTFEATERKRYYGDEVDKGLTQITSDLYASPNSFDENFAAGTEYIDSIPDETFSQIEKDKLKKAWKEKAQLAALQGMPPEERIEKLGGARTMQVPGDGSAAALIRKFEGYRDNAYWDVNHFRTGYGSDTITREDGTVVKVTRDTITNKADAERDLARRIGEFENIAAGQVGIDAWSKLPENVRAGLTSITYNYGELPGRLHAAVRSGDPEKIAAAVERLAGDNGGVNRSRRNQEAAVIRGDMIVKGEGFDPSKADPRFKDLDYQTAQKMIDQADIEIGKMEKAEIAAAANIAKQAAADAKAAATQAVDDYNLAIELEPGGVTTEEILADERIDNGQKASLIDKLEKANKDAVDLQKAMTRANGDGLYNGLDSDDKKSANLAFDEMTKGADEDYLRLYGESFAAKGIVTQKYSDSILHGAQSKSPATAAMAGNAASRLVENYPQAVNTSMTKQDRDQLQDLATSYDFMKNKMGLSDEQIGQRLIDRNDPEKMRQREQLMKSETVKEHLKTITPDYVADQMAADQTWGEFFSDGFVALGTDPAGAAAISGEWKRMFQENLGATGSIAEATDLTNSQFKRSYGPTPQGQAGGAAITYLPATLAYPPAPDGTHDYLQSQAIEALAEEGIKTDRVYFEHALDNGVNLTEMGHRKGIAPEYQLYYDDENGERQAFPYPFYADPVTPTAVQNMEKAIETGDAIRAAREANTKSAVRELDRQEEIRTGKPTKSVFEEMNEAVEEFETLPPPKGTVRDVPTAGGGGF